ncbi:MAG TPA: hypothetical protein H9706_03005 [Candidatus Gemmiger stercorigallinarum]|nr:hypothetical protein [Candidatus Gemmiger stercorigallinarum]
MVIVSAWLSIKSAAGIPCPPHCFHGRQIAPEKKAARMQTASGRSMCCPAGFAGRDRNGKSLHSAGFKTPFWGDRTKKLADRQIGQSMWRVVPKKIFYQSELLW